MIAPAARASLLALALALVGCSGGEDTGTGPEDLDGDGHAGEADCDETDPDVFVGAGELCNGIDDDCDGVVDPGWADDATSWYRDVDDDGYGDDDFEERACAAPEGYAELGGDCDDDDDAVHPGAGERCNGVDDDCDEVVDPANAEDAPSWHPDSDDDGYGSATTAATACSAPAGFVADGTDCDDRDPDVNPAADELCNGVDDDCDELIDEGGAGGAEWYYDADGDGWGDDATVADTCEPGEGWVREGGDCDDGDGGVNPGASDTPDDGVDQDCYGGDLTCADAELRDTVGEALATGSFTGGGDDLAPSCLAAGGEDVRLHWVAPVDGAFVFTLTGASGAGLAVYDTDGACATDEVACDEGATAVVEVELAAGAERLVVVDAGTAGSGAWSLTIDTTDELACDDGIDGAGDGDGLIDCADPECAATRDCSTALADADLGSATGAAVATGTTAGAGDDWPASCGGDYADDYAYAWLAPAAGTWVFSLAGSDYDTVLSVYTPDGATELACNDDATDTTSEVAVTTRAGERVIVVVDGKNRASGDYVLGIE